MSATGNNATENPGSEPALPSELVEMRASIDNLDAAFIHLMAERFRITKRIGQLKAEKNLPPADKKREARQIARLRLLAEQADLDPEIAEKLLSFIMKEVVQYHVAISQEKAHERLERTDDE